jgi:hypothetical protein
LEVRHSDLNISTDHSRGRPGSIAIVICIEQNRLADEALLLIESIRNFAGVLANAPIYTFNPRANGPLEIKVRACLRKFGVVHSDESLNQRYRDYPLANKILVCAHMEEHAKEDVVVFLDSDSVILKTPAAFILPQGFQAALTPVWDVGIGATGPSDPANAFWKAASDACGHRGEFPLVKTVVTGREVGLYLNSGLIVARRSSGLFSKWLRCFESIYDSSVVRSVLGVGPTQHVGTGPSFFLEQASLSFAVAPFYDQVTWLGALYNCPLHHRSALQATHGNESFDLEDVIHFHYNRFLHMPGAIDAIWPPVNHRSPQYAWLKDRLPLEPKQKLVDQRIRLETLALEMRRWRIRLADATKGARRSPESPRL